LAGASVIAGLIFVFTYNRIMLCSFNAVLSRARGLNPTVMEYLFVSLMTAVVVASLKLVGALLVLVLLVVPAAGAQNIARNLKQFVWISMFFATVSTTAGLLLSGLLPVPSGAVIVLVSSILFYCSLLLKSLLVKKAFSQ